MGKYNGGILGRFSGKVGAVIGAMFRGTAVMKGLPTPSNKPASLKQLTQQLKWTLVTGFVGRLSEFIMIGYQNHTTGATPLNAASQYHLKNAVTGVYPNFKMDYAQVSLTEKSTYKKLSPLFNAELETAPMHRIVLTWEPGEGLRKPSSDTDLLQVIFYSELHDEFVGTGVEATRNSGTITIASPRVYSDGPLHGWAFFVSEDGTLFSPTVYLGTITTTTA